MQESVRAVVRAIFRALSRVSVLVPYPAISPANEQARRFYSARRAGPVSVHLALPGICRPALRVRSLRVDCRRQFSGETPVYRVRRREVK